MQLYLIRHGQSYVNLKDWTQGNTDEGLTALGQEQASRLAAWLPGHLPSVDVIYASTMRRARETAAAVAAGYNVEIQFDDRLREVRICLTGDLAFRPCAREANSCRQEMIDIPPVAGE